MRCRGKHVGKRKCGPSRLDGNFHQTHQTVCAACYASLIMRDISSIIFQLAKWIFLWKMRRIRLPALIVWKEWLVVGTAPLPAILYYTHFSAYSVAQSGSKQLCIIYFLLCTWTQQYWISDEEASVVRNQAVRALCFEHVLLSGSPNFVYSPLGCAFASKFLNDESTRALCIRRTTLIKQTPQLSDGYVSRAQITKWTSRVPRSNSPKDTTANLVLFTGIV